MQFLHSLFQGWKSLQARYPWALPVSLWLILIIVVSIRASITPNKGTVYPVFSTAGHAYSKSEPVFVNDVAPFRYAPVWAAFFSLFNAIPDPLGSIVWRLINLAVLVWGAYRFQKYFFPEWTEVQRSWWWIGLFPFCVGSFNNAQANLLLLGLLLGSMALFVQHRWNWCGLLLAVAISLKVYPLALALLLLLLRPKELLPPLVISLLVIAGIPFAFQNYHYVVELYRSWVECSLGDFRIDNDLKNSNRDLWLLVKAYHLPMEYRVYQLLQLTTAALLAGWVFHHRITLVQFPGSRTQLVWLFSLAITWMLVFGPASESSTYALTAPLAAMAIVMVLTTEQSRLTMFLICLAILVCLLSHFSSAFSHGRILHHYGIHPIGTLLLLVAVLRINFGISRNSLPIFTGTSATIST